MKLWIKQEGGQYWYFDINHWYVLLPSLPPSLLPSFTSPCLSVFVSGSISSPCFLSLLSFLCLCLYLPARLAYYPPSLPSPLPPSFFFLYREKRVFPQTTPANISAIATGMSREEKEGGREGGREGG